MPRLLLARFVATLLSMAACLAHAGEFTYTIPEGWRDLKQDAREGRLAGSGLPAAVQREALEDKFVVYAIDPASVTAGGVTAVFNAAEVPSRGALSLDQIQEVSRNLVSQLRANGHSVQPGETRGDSWGDVTVGVVTVDVRLPGGTQRFLQYLIPGRNAGTLLTYTAPASSFDAYLPLFEASARATKGAYASAKWGDRKFLIVMAFLLPLIGGVVLVKTLARRSGATFAGDVLEPAAEKAPAAPARKPITSKYVWECEACGKPVPIRLDQCRCGGKRPAD